MDAAGLAALAAETGLSSIETPLTGMLPDLSTETIDRFRSELEQASIALVVDTGVVDVDLLRTALPLAERAGAKIVRATVSRVLEGARTTIPGGWEDHLREIRRRVVALRPLLEAHDLVLALENHQDTTSDELIELCEAGGPRVGITLDVVNPLAVAEEPLAFARKVGPLIRNVHLKDYHIYPTPSGYRLVRCALGEGVAPFPELLEVLRATAPEPTLHIELAALYARHIRVLDDDWWDGFPPHDVRDVLPALRVAARHARPPDEPWQTPWETGAPAKEVARYERDQFERSVAYLRAVGA